MNTMALLLTYSLGRSIKSLIEINFASTS